MIKLENITDDLIVEIARCAKDVFSNGIYVPSDKHYCGWDFISFEDISTNSRISILTDTFDIFAITNGCYEEHEFEGKTLKEVLILTDGVYEFEKENIKWV
jgi:hypothetical protein